ncbi:hypothetical protein [Ureibacillus sp. GCM10028918]|uniref:hypothetical protein n=1 Tax=Ureibacillus sp. GCM10028918 TaxID=3273429 RepID=UPI003622D7B1
MIKIYFHSFERPQFGLTYYETTIIPTESFLLFYDVVTSSDYFYKSLLNLMVSTIKQAIEERILGFNLCFYYVRGY